MHVATEKIRYGEEKGEEEEEEEDKEVDVVVVARTFLSCDNF